MTENKVENSLPKMLPGAVCMQMLKCGKPACRCARGELHGPFFYRFWREGKRLRKAYVRKSQVAEIRAACDVYRDEQRQIRQINREGVRQWRELKALLKELGL